MKKIFFTGITLLAFTLAKAQTFTPQDEGSKVHFVIKNLAINTGGDLAGLKGKIKFDAKKPQTASFDVTTEVSTVDTDNEKRDEHLKKDDFFDVEKYPTIRIKSTSIEAGADLKHFVFNGILTIKDVSKPVTFNFTAEGLNGGALFTGDEFEINRRDFNLGKESATMSDKVRITLKVFAK